MYRGFLVDEDEYVRAGKKVDGADYYKQMLVKVFPIQLTRKQQCVHLGT